MKKINPDIAFKAWGSCDLCDSSLQNVQFVWTVANEMGKRITQVEDVMEQSIVVNNGK